MKKVSNVSKEFKARENRARRKLSRQGFSLKKNRATINPYNIGGYMIINSSNLIECGGEFNGYSLCLEDVENYVNQ